MLDKPVLFSKVLAYTFAFFFREWRRALGRTTDGWASKVSSKKPSDTRDRNIVIVGASFAGYQAARVLSMNLPPGTSFRVVVIEPNSHFQFTWVLPRFCVAKGHEHKAFIPYRQDLKELPEGALHWVQDRVVEVTKTHVKLQESGEEIPYEYLIVATGSAVKDGLPSRPNAADKLEAMKKMQDMQNGIENATKIVVVGGGAAGVELATDAKSKYPDKTVVLVHSRAAPMHRFSKTLQDAAVEGINKLGIELILEDRVVSEESGTVTLRSGKVIECDYFINCVGQKPASDILKTLVPGAITESGHIKVKPTLQIADDAFPNIYACGDVADTKTANPNGRSANRQADVAADNVLQTLRGKKPSYTFTNYWADGIIKLTLGIDKSVTYLSDGNKQLLWEAEEKDEALMAADCWRKFGATPFEDDYMPKEATTEAATPEAATPKAADKEQV
ncbi:hypothetical protein FALCPG4_008848 [Fusarium falciforme]